MKSMLIVRKMSMFLVSLFSQQVVTNSAVRFD